jgi:hypothetical protein
MIIQQLCPGIVSGVRWYYFFSSKHFQIIKVDFVRDARVSEYEIFTVSADFLALSERRDS